MMTIKGRLLGTCPMLKAFSSENFCPVENVLTTPVKIRAGVLAVDDLKNPPKKNEKIAE